MQRYAARLILPPLLAMFATTGCGSHPPRQDAGLENASGSGASTAAEPHDLLPAPRQDPAQFLPDRPLAATDEAPPAEHCDPNYDPCVPVDSDVDCDGGTGNGPAYVAGPVQVVGSDPYDLDRDGDRVACEN